MPSFDPDLLKTTSRVLPEVGTRAIALWVFSRLPSMSAVLGFTARAKILNNLYVHAYAHGEASLLVGRRIQQIEES